MRVRILIAAAACLFPAYSCCQAGAAPSADGAAIHRLLGQYAQAVDSLDFKMLAQIWSHSPDVSFIYLIDPPQQEPEEAGFTEIVRLIGASRERAMQAVNTVLKTPSMR